jgi:hypothetical protein
MKKNLLLCSKNLLVFSLCLKYVLSCFLQSHCNEGQYCEMFKCKNGLIPDNMLNEENLQYDKEFNKEFNVKQNANQETEPSKVRLLTQPTCTTAITNTFFTNWNLGLPYWNGGVNNWMSYTNFETTSGTPPTNYLFVDPNFLGTSNGSCLTPFKNVQSAAAVATGTPAVPIYIYVTAGTYPTSFLLLANTFIIGAGPATTFITGAITVSTGGSWTSVSTGRKISGLMYLTYTSASSNFDFHAATVTDSEFIIFNCLINGAGTFTVKGYNSQSTTVNFIRFVSSKITSSVSFLGMRTYGINSEFTSLTLADQPLLDCTFYCSGGFFNSMTATANTNLVGIYNYDCYSSGFGAPSITVNSAAPSSVPASIVMHTGVDVWSVPTIGTRTGNFYFNYLSSQDEIPYDPPNVHSNTWNGGIVPTDLTSTLNNLVQINSERLVVDTGMLAQSNLNAAPSTMNLGTTGFLQKNMVLNSYGVLYPGMYHFHVICSSNSLSYASLTGVVLKVTIGSLSYFGTSSPYATATAVAGSILLTSSSTIVMLTTSTLYSAISISLFRAAGGISTAFTCRLVANKIA